MRNAVCSPWENISHNVCFGNLFYPIFLNEINCINEIKLTLQYLLNHHRACSAEHPGYCWFLLPVQLSRPRSRGAKLLRRRSLKVGISKFIKQPDFVLTGYACVFVTLSLILIVEIVSFSLPKCVCVCSYVCMCICVCMYIYMCVCVTLYVCMYVCVCIYVCMCIYYVCMSVYMYRTRKRRSKE